METWDKLRLILRLRELTQTELATQLGVTFAALNRWVNAKATPRRRAQAKIDELYLEATGQKIIPPNALAAKKSILFHKRRVHKNILKEIADNPDIKNQFLLSLTYNSNRIEGSTLSEDETAAILFQNVALPTKNLTEQLEAKNHQAALEFLFDYLSERRPVNEELFLKLHSILMNAIRTDAGVYRRHAVRIVGSYVPTANFLKVPTLMRQLVQTTSHKHKDIFSHMAIHHSRFEQIHPFADGNGRIGRLILQAMVLKANLAPVVILQERKKLYMTCLNKAQIQGDSSPLDDFICDAILEGFSILERKEGRRRRG